MEEQRQDYQVLYNDIDLLLGRPGASVFLKLAVVLMSYSLVFVFFLK